MPKFDTQLVERFEHDQKRFGTETALYNFAWTIAADIMKLIGVRRIKTKSA